MTAVIYARYSSPITSAKNPSKARLRECTAYAEKNDITIVKHLH